MVKAGRVLEAKFMQYTDGNMLSLFFDDLSKHKVVKIKFTFLLLISNTVSFLTNFFVETLIAKCCRLCNVLGSRAGHGAHAQIIACFVLQTRARG